jgi:GDP/UDP-N,N'-diacetylbacillosamine 2-epimerase (hydrolysing)
VKKFIFLLESRASYGYSKNLIKLFKKKNVKTLVTGTHYAKDLGNSFNEILKDKIKINYSHYFNPTEKNISKSIGKLIIKTNNIVNKFKPDLVLIFGDRIELMAVAVACVYRGVLVGHVQAGDKSGHIDDITRMALAKLVHIHFPATELAKNRLLKMGEEKFRIHKVGAPQLDDINYKKIIKNKILKINNKNYDLNDRKYVVLLQHPVFEDRKEYGKIFEKTLIALLKLELEVFFIYPNYDPGYKNIIEKIRDYDGLFKKKLIMVKHLERKDFLKLVALSQCLIGNSSSGILESASLKIGAVNIGNRQSGREQNINIFNAKYDSKDIFKKILLAINFKRKKIKLKNIHGDGKSSIKIAEFIEKINRKKFLTKKTLY